MMADRAYGHNRRNYIKAVRDQNRVWGIVQAQKAAYITAAFCDSVHSNGMMKTLFKRYRERVRIVRDAEGVVLKKDCGELAAGGAHFSSIDVAREYVRSSKLVTL